MFGAEHKVFFEDENGLDGIVVMRGIAKDQAMDGSHSQSFQTLTVGLLRDDCSCLDISKYTWPFNNFEKKTATRVLTTENLKDMIFKNGSEKAKNPEVQSLSTGKPCTAAQYIAEIVCTRKSEKDNKGSLAFKFWSNSHKRRISNTNKISKQDY